MDRIAALIEPMSTPVHTATISDVLRALADLGLPSLERLYGVRRPVSMADPTRTRRACASTATARRKEAASE